jgi:hypothetical protein
MTLRFSLRGLLLLTVAVAAVCWYRDLPRQNANRFVALLEAGEYRAAEQVLDRRGWLSKPSNGFSDWTVEKAGPADWVRGLYPLVVAARLGDKSVRPGQYFVLAVEVTATGVERPKHFRIAPHRTGR